jgi:polyferredoxin
VATKAAVNSWPIRTIRIISFLAFLYAGFGYLNRSYLHWVDSFWLSSYSDKLAIVAFGIWRVASERNRYTRNRIAVLVSLTTIGYLVIPYFIGSTFFNNHLIGSVWFFAYLAIVFALGRRADCSWYCPCVGIRDTVGDAFRASTVKGSWWWKLRHLKWVFMGSMLVYLLVVVVLRISPSSLAFLPSNTTARYIYYFWVVTNGLYFLSFLIVPWTGNRNYCRYMCPWGALYGVVGNKLGFFKIEANREKCIYCQMCERECDMGVPIRRLIRKHGVIQAADCVGCGRCIQACPKGALRFVDIRDYLGFRHEFPQRLKAKPSVRQREEVTAAVASDATGEAPR